MGRFGILQVGGYDSTVFRKPVSEFVPPVMITPIESVNLQSLTLYIFYLACTILSGQAPDRASPSYGVSGLPFEFFLDFQVHWLQNRGSNLPIHQPHILLRKNTTLNMAGQISLPAGHPCSQEVMICSGGFETMLSTPCWPGV